MYLYLLRETACLLLCQHYKTDCIVIGQTHTHTYIHTHTHIYIHTLTHTVTHTYTEIYKHTITSFYYYA